MSGDDDDVPDEIGFTKAKSTAVSQRERETKAAKDDMAHRKSKMKRKQAWFQESKSKSSGKKKKIALGDDTDSVNEHAPEKNAIKNYGPELDDMGDEQSDVDDHFFQNNDEPSNNAATSDISDPPKSSEPDFIPLKDTAGNPVTVVPLRQRPGSYRDDAVKFARDRFSPPNVYRVPAAKTTSIAMKKRAARSAAKC
ncbi:hypothetical protein RvY_15920 [Ramazzottius varieornatus]|uniref:Uncharacterized protein n=1 Tax=Ramazzottius varieornatus TaxID=947166 RepID=A0A1D1W3A5_RAMVA|nr:hypothetical protein RvY_15920 [Ramazzottius varieornatus]